MRCVSCGTKNPENSNFCFNCGKPFQTTSSSQSWSSPSYLPVSDLYEETNTDPENAVSSYPFPLPPENSFNTKGETEEINYPYPLNSSYPAHTERSHPTFDMPLQHKLVETPFNNKPTSSFETAAIPEVQPLKPEANPFVSNLPGYFESPFSLKPPSLSYQFQSVSDMSTVSPAPNLPHPVLYGAVNLPFDLQSRPQNYFSYINSNGKIIVARRAGFWTRFAATVLDGLLLGVPLGLLYLSFLLSEPTASSALTNSAVNPFQSGDSAASINPVPPWVNLLVLLVPDFYSTIMTTLSYGQTIGKKVLKIKVIKLNGQKPDWLTSSLRFFLGYHLSGIALWLGFITIGSDPFKQGWHDKLARTLVVETGELMEERDFFFPYRSLPIPPVISSPTP